MDTPSTLKEELAAIDIRVAELKENIKLGEDLAILHENPEFMHVILNAYLEKEADRLFGVLTTPSYLKRDVMENIMDKLTTIRNVKQFFVTVIQNANMAQEQIDEEEDLRKEITARDTQGDTDG